MKHTISSALIIALSAMTTGCQTTPGSSKTTQVEPAVGAYTQTTDIPKGILTPDVVDTSIGTLNFFDGAPTPETVQLAYDNLDRSRGVEALDGSMDVYFSPTAPEGFEGNWLQTIPGKSWFTIFRLYGPLEPWLNKTWRPSEVIEVK